MNILYLEHYAGSPEMGMEFRPYYLAQEWIKMGHHVRIIAGDYSHLRIKNPEVKKDFTDEIIDGITYTWVRTGEYQGNGIARAMTMFRFVHKLRKRAKWIAENWKPDVIIASSTYPIDTFAGQKIKKYSKRFDGKKATLIHEVHDMWPITLIEIGGMKRSNPFVILMQMGENSFCKHSDYIVSLPCEAKEYFIKHGMLPEKFRSIMNGVVLEEWENPEPLPNEHQTLLDRLHNSGKFIICFFGSVHKSYCVKELIEAKNVVNNEKVAVVIVGEGYQKEELESMAITDVFFLPRIPKTAIPTLMNNIDCCYVAGVKNSVLRFGISMNKLFDSMMSGRPILYAVEAPNNFIEEYDCGISVASEDVGALVDGINQLIKLSACRLEEMGRNGRKAVLDHFNYNKLAKQFSELFY